jgi:hypothetical protein
MKRCICSPTFGTNPDRIKFLTREVLLIEAGVDTALVEELTDGPEHPWGKNGKLWQKGDRVVREFDRWKLVYVDTAGT